MTRKLDINGIAASFAVLTAIALCSAPAAGADTLSPPPLPGFGDLPTVEDGEASPAADAEEPVADYEPQPVPGIEEIETSVDRRAARVLKARLAGRRLVLSLRCSVSGRVGVGRPSRRFTCRSGKSKVALVRNKGRRARLARGRSVRLRVVLRSGGETARVPLTIRRRGASRGASTSAGAYWNDVKSSCTSHGVDNGALLRVDTTTFNGFGLAAPHETIYWRAVVAQYSGGKWSYYPHSWDSYSVSTWSTGYSDGNYAVVGGGGYGYPVAQSFNVASDRWSIPYVQVWTQRSGYRSAWVGPSVSAFGAVYTSGAFCWPY